MRSIITEFSYSSAFPGPLCINRFVFIFNFGQERDQVSISKALFVHLYWSSLCICCEFSGRSRSFLRQTFVKYTFLSSGIFSRKPQLQIHVRPLHQSMHNTISTLYSVCEILKGVGVSKRINLNKIKPQVNSINTELKRNFAYKYPINLRYGSFCSTLIKVLCFLFAQVIPRLIFERINIAVQSILT